MDVRASLAPAYHAIHNRTTGTASASGMLNIEQSGYWFNSLLQTVTPTVDTEATWNWVAPTSDGEPDISTYTITKGVSSDANSVKSITGAIVNSMNISGAVNEPLASTTEPA